jgi:hypothetical protein
MTTRHSSSRRTSSRAWRAAGAARLGHRLQGGADQPPVLDRAIEPVAFKVDDTIDAVIAGVRLLPLALNAAVVMSSRSTKSGVNSSHGLSGQGPYWPVGKEFLLTSLMRNGGIKRNKYRLLLFQ